MPEAPPERTDRPASAFFIGVYAGAASGLLGLGGGMLMAPALSRLLRMAPARANGTALTTMTLGAALAVARYHGEAVSRQQPGIPWDAVLLMTLGAMVGALIGAPLARQPWTATLRPLFGVLVVALGGMMLWAGKGWLPTGPVMLFALGLVANILAAWLRLGGGLLVVPALTLGLGLPQTQAQAISLGVIVLTSVGAAAVHLLRGTVSGTAMLPAGIGVAVGAYFLAGAAWALPEAWLQTMFGITLGLVGGQLFFRSLARRERGGEGGDSSGSAAGE